jgi:hypothetical protein
MTPWQWEGGEYHSWDMVRTFSATKALRRRRMGDRRTAVLDDLVSRHAHAQLLSILSEMDDDDDFEDF